MIKLSDLGQVYIVCGKTDMRRGIDTLASMVKDKFNLDPFSGQVFLFCGGSQDRFKALYWDGQGYWLLYKRFENGKMNWPKNQDEVRELSPEQVDWLMKGFSIEPKISEATARNFYLILRAVFRILITIEKRGGYFIMSETTLEKIIQEQATTIRNLTEEISLLREQVAYLTQKRYGKSSEQTAMSGQTSLFEEENTDEDGDLPRRRIPRRHYYL